jgi:hypothetical protein
MRVRKNLSGDANVSDMSIKHIWSCRCGEETPCRTEDMRLGAVWECKRCEQVWGCVYPSRGGKAWVKIGDDDVSFHDLLGKNYEPEEDSENWSDGMR